MTGDRDRIIALESALRQAVMELREAGAVMLAWGLNETASIYFKAADRKDALLNEERSDAQS